MLKIAAFLLLLYLTETNEEYVNNEILSILPDVKSDIFILPNGTSLTVFPNPKSARFSNRTLLRVSSTDSNVLSLICYPKSEEEYEDVYILSHTTCRRMGFMTFTSIKSKMSPLNRARIQPKYLNCSGPQRGASCKLLRTVTENCRTVTEVTCGACNGTFKGFKGTIQSTGFPFASFDDVTCEWNVMVPEHHGIILSFNQFDAIDTESADLPCGLHRPYVNIMYGIQSKVTVQRYCQLSEVRNLSIPFHTVKIIVFTGLLRRQETMFSTKELGISITFEATVPTEDSYGSPLKLLAFFLLGVVFIYCTIICRYIQKYKFCDYIVKDRDSPFVDQPIEQPYNLHNYNRTRMDNGNANLNRCSKADGSNERTVELQRNPKMVYESEKDINERSNLLGTSAGYISSVTRRDSEVSTEKLNVSLHKKLHLVQSYNGQNDPNRLSVSPPPTNYYDYPPNVMASRHASSESSSIMEEKKRKLKFSMSTC